jgi:hypothetical protein
MKGLSLVEPEHSHFALSSLSDHRAQAEVFSSLTLLVKYPLENTIMRKDKRREITRVCVWPWGA